MYRMTEGQRRHYLVLLFAGRVRQAIDFRDECDTQWTEHPDQWEYDTARGKGNDEC